MRSACLWGAVACDGPFAQAGLHLALQFPSAKQVCVNGPGVAGEPNPGPAALPLRRKSALLWRWQPSVTQALAQQFARLMRLRKKFFSSGEQERDSAWLCDISARQALGKRAHWAAVLCACIQEALVWGVLLAHCSEELGHVCAGLAWQLMALCAP